MAPQGRPLTVAACNLWRGTHEPEAQAGAVVALDVEVLCVIEHSTVTSAALHGAGLTERFAHVVEDPETREPECFGALVASRHPFVDVRWVDLGGRPNLIVDLDVEGTTVRLVPVHTQAPIRPTDVPLWHSTIAATAAVGDHQGPVVLAGDWNATGGHRAFRRALATHGLVDAQTALGHRWMPTWPQRGPLVPRPLREVPFRPPTVLTLDHVVVTPDVGVESLRSIPVPGTDHRGLIAHLRLPS